MHQGAAAAWSLGITITKAQGGRQPQAQVAEAGTPVPSSALTSHQTPKMSSAFLCYLVWVPNFFFFLFFFGMTNKWFCVFF